jgi:hypothetical protein
MKFEKIKADQVLTSEQLFKVLGGRAQTYTAVLTYKDVRNDKDESDRSEDTDQNIQ